MLEPRIVRSSEGDVYEHMWKFKHGSLRGGRFDFAVGDIEYLGGPPLHVHEVQDDTFFVLEGVLAVQVGDDVFDLGPGDFATVPPGLAHTFSNIQKDQKLVRIVNLMTPGGLDAQFNDMKLIGEAVNDPDKMVELRTKHGLSLVGPTLGEKLGLA